MSMKSEIFLHPFQSRSCEYELRTGYFVSGSFVFLGAAPRDSRESESRQSAPRSALRLFAGYPTPPKD